MSLHREDEKKKIKHYPFENITDEEFERIFNEMQRFIDSDSFRELVEDILKNDFQYDKHIVHGLKGYSEYDKKETHDGFCVDHDVQPFPSDLEQEPLADIIKDEDSISVTIPLPDVQKKNVTLRVSSTELEIIINRDGKTFYDSIELSAFVDPDTAIASFNNGILDVIIARSHSYEQGKDINIL